MSTRKVLTLGLILVIGLNIYMSYKLYFKDIEYQYLYEEYNEIANSFIGESSNLIENGKLIHPQVNLPKEGFRLKIFIPQTSCPECLTYEIPQINDLFKKHQEMMDIYLPARDDINDEEYNVQFDYKIINPTASLYDINVSTTNPTASLVDNKGKIYVMYMSEVGNEKKSDIFFQKIDILLENLR